jgi:AraC-like DNA-binding protein
MYDQIREDKLYIMLYAVATAMSMLASCYLLFRRGNAFATDITPPVRLRRWAAAFFAFSALSHMWYMPIFFLSSSEDVKRCDLIGGLLDSMTFFPLSVALMFVMLQDRRRPLWPIAVIFAPFILGNAYNVVTCNYSFLPMARVYFLLFCIGLIIYMVRALRQYGRWLRDNYADLEHKEVWQSFVVLAIMLLVFVAYALTSEGPVYVYAMLVISVVFLCYILWRVETLSDLSIPLSQGQCVEEPATIMAEDVEGNGLSQAMREHFGALLQQHCIDTQLYLQHDLNLSQLAKAIGTNRFYLSQYFSSQGTTYNAYINDLRISHFESLYRETDASQRSITAQQLAKESGYRSYSTFCSIIRRKTGMSVTAWMKSLHEEQAE